jgi:hypothetical protein
MISFLQYLFETKRLVRFDDLPANSKPFVPRTRRYGFVGQGDKIASGSAEEWGDYPKGSDYREKTGLFAADYSSALPYALPRDTRWIKHGKRTKTEKPTLIMHSRDLPKIKKHITVKTEYRKRPQGFTPTRVGFSGEHFSERQISPTPIAQTKHSNVLDMISKHYNIRFVDNLNKTKRELETSNVKHTAEGW